MALLNVQNLRATLFYSFGKYSESTVKINPSNISLEVYLDLCSHNSIVKRRKSVINVWKFYPYGANQSWFCLSCPHFTSFFSFCWYSWFSIFSGFPPTIFIRPQSLLSDSFPPFQRGSHALSDHCFRAGFPPPARPPQSHRSPPLLLPTGGSLPLSSLLCSAGNPGTFFSARFFDTVDPLWSRVEVFFRGGVAVFF